MKRIPILLVLLCAGSAIAKTVAFWPLGLDPKTQGVDCRSAAGPFRLTPEGSWGGSVASPVVGRPANLADGDLVDTTPCRANSFYATNGRLLDTWRLTDGVLGADDLLCPPNRGSVILVR